MKKLSLLLLIGCTAGTDDAKNSDSDTQVVAPDTDRDTDTQVVDPDTDRDTDTPTATPRPVYLTVAGHLEDDLAYTDCPYYLPRRDSLLQFGELMHDAGVPFRIQASYEWFSGARLCEDDGIMADTHGVSSLEYMASTYGFAIDTHQEGASILDASSGNNFADIHWSAEQVCSTVSGVSGFQWDNPNQYTNLQRGEQGLLHPEHTFAPDILSGGVSQDHTNGDFSSDMSAMGMWIPSGFDEASFFTHDTGPDARMVYVGSGPNQWIADWGPPGDCHYGYTADFIEALVTQIERGDLDGQGWHTFTFFIPQRVMLSAEEWSKVTDNLDRIAPLVASGKVVYTQYEDLVDMWKAEGAEPYVVTYDELDPSLRTCP